MDSSGLAGDIAMQEGRERCHGDCKQRRRGRKKGNTLLKGNTLFWHGTSPMMTFWGDKKVGAQSAAKRGEAG